MTFRTWWDVAGNRAASPSMARAHTKVLAEADVRNTLARITAPTLILHRDSSRFVPIGHGRYLAEHIADHAMSSYRSRFAVLGGRHRAAARRDRAARAAASTPNACSPRSCSPTSSAPPSAPPHSATTDGATCSTTTTPPSATSSSARAPLFLAIRFTGVCHQARDAANPPIDRPVSVTFAACASGGTWLQGMTWNSWGPEGANEPPAW